MSELEKTSAAEGVADPGEKTDVEPTRGNSGLKRLIVVGLVLVPIAMATTCVIAEIRELPWWCRLRAELGSAEMQYKMGNICADGDAEEQKDADGWFRKAAENGSVKAQYALAMRTRSEEERIVLLKKAAGNGSSEAQYELGAIYFRIGHYAEAVECYRKAADGGLPKARHALAGCLLRGCGVARDRDKAKELYRQAAEQGYGPSEAQLEELADEEKKAGKGK